MVSAVAVPRSPNRSGTTTKSVEAGVTQDRVSRVPPTTPMERLRARGPSWPLGSVAAGAAPEVTGWLSMSVMERFRSTGCDG